MLRRLTERGLLAECVTEPCGEAGDGDARRRSYQLTARGRSLLRDELARLELLLRSAPANSAIAGRSGGGRPR